VTRNHELLGVVPGASEDEIKEAYREMVQVWHPDRFAHDAKLQKKAQAKLQEINRAFHELSKPPAAAQEPPPAAAFFTQAPERAPRFRASFWPIAAALAAVAGLLIYLGSQDSPEGRAKDPKQFLQEAGALTQSGTRRYWVGSASGNGFYIIEGPRQPLEWEADALAQLYNAQTPRRKQSLGPFTISQAMKPGEDKPAALSYRVKDDIIRLEDDFGRE
jgi:curved DNA-binding protein CbpA